MTQHQPSPVAGPSSRVRIRQLQELSRQARLATTQDVGHGDRESRLDAGCLDAVEHLSSELKVAATALGFEAPVARRLLSLRELLDSHILTATALAGCDLDGSAAVAMVSRGVEAVTMGLSRLDDPMLSAAGTSIAGD